MQIAAFETLETPTFMILTHHDYHYINLFNHVGSILLKGFLLSLLMLWPTFSCNFEISVDYPALSIEYLTMDSEEKQFGRGNFKPVNH